MNQLKKNFNVDSGLRASGTNTDFYSNMNMPNIGTDPYNKIAVVSCEIPKTYYMLDSNTTNSIVVNRNGGGDVDIAISPLITYTATTLAAEFEANLNTEYGDSFTINYSPATGHFTIGNNLEFTINFTNAPNLAKYFGFEPDVTYTSGAISPFTEAIESIAFSNLQRYDCLVIKSNLALNNNNDELAFIYPVSHSEGSIIKFEPQNPNFTAVSCRDSNSSQNKFSLVDYTTNKAIDLNGSEWRMLITMWKD